MPENTHIYTIVSYVLYLSISVGLTIWVARTLHTNGRIFLVDSFLGNETLADSVNHLLVVGFYLINIGYVSVVLKYGDKPASVEQTFEYISTKIGVVMLVLGVMHFVNVYVFSRMRKRATMRRMPPPVRPDDFVAPVPNWTR